MCNQYMSTYQITSALEVLRYVTYYIKRMSTETNVNQKRKREREKERVQNYYKKGYIEGRLHPSSKYNFEKDTLIAIQMKL
jgi:hypothetical protein